MNKKNSQTSSFPYMSLLFGFICWTSVGVLSCFIFLASVAPIPVSSGASLQEKPNESIPPTFQIKKEVRYYRTTAIAHRVEALAKKLFSSTTKEIEITSGDLNSWAKEQFRESNRKPDSESDKNTSVSLVPQQPSFQIAAEELHVTYPISIEAFGKKFKVLVLCSGSFDTKEFTPEWNLSSLSINSAPVPFKSVFYKLIKPKAMDAIAKNDSLEKVQSAWNMIKEIEIKNSVMILHRK